MNYSQLQQVLDQLFSATYHDDIRLLNICIKSATTINSTFDYLKSVVGTIEGEINRAQSSGHRDVSTEQSELEELLNIMTGYEPQQRAALNKFENILRDMYEQTLLALKDPGDPTAGITELTPEQRTDTVVSFAVLGVDMDKSIHKANTILSRLSSSTEEPVADEPVADEPVADEPVADEPVTDSYNPYVDYMRHGHKSY